MPPSDRTLGMAKRFDGMLKEVGITTKPTLTTGVVVDEIVRLRRQRPRLSYQAIADVFNDAGWPTERGGRWHPATVRDLLIRFGPDKLATEATTSSVASLVVEGLKELIEERKAKR